MIDRVTDSGRSDADTVSQAPSAMQKVTIHHADWTTAASAEWNVVARLTVNNSITDDTTHARLRSDGGSSWRPLTIEEEKLLETNCYFKKNGKCG